MPEKKLDIDELSRDIVENCKSLLIFKLKVSKKDTPQDVLRCFGDHSMELFIGGDCSSEKISELEKEFKREARSACKLEKTENILENFLLSKEFYIFVIFANKKSDESIAYMIVSNDVSKGISSEMYTSMMKPGFIPLAEHFLKNSPDSIIPEIKFKEASEIIRSGSPETIIPRLLGSSPLNIENLLSTAISPAKQAMMKKRGLSLPGLPGIPGKNHMDYGKIVDALFMVSGIKENGEGLMYMMMPKTRGLYGLLGDKDYRRHEIYKKLGKEQPPELFMSDVHKGCNLKDLKVLNLDTYNPEALYETFAISFSSIIPQAKSSKEGYKKIIEDHRIVPLLESIPLQAQGTIVDKFMDRNMGASALLMRQYLGAHYGEKNFQDWNELIKSILKGKFGSRSIFHGLYYLREEERELINISPENCEDIAKDLPPIEQLLFRLDFLTKMKKNTDYEYMRDLIDDAKKLGHSNFVVRNLPQIPNDLVEDWEYFLNSLEVAEENRYKRLGERRCDEGFSNYIPDSFMFLLIKEKNLLEGKIDYNDVINFVRFSGLSSQKNKDGLSYEKLYYIFIGINNKFIDLSLLKLSDLQSLILGFVKCNISLMPIWDLLPESIKLNLKASGKVDEDLIQRERILSMDSFGKKVAHEMLNHGGARDLAYLLYKLDVSSEDLPEILSSLCVEGYGEIIRASYPKIVTEDFERTVIIESGDMEALARNSTIPLSIKLKYTKQISDLFELPLDFTELMLKQGHKGSLFFGTLSNAPDYYHEYIKDLSLKSAEKDFIVEAGDIEDLGKNSEIWEALVDLNVEVDLFASYDKKEMFKVDFDPALLSFQEFVSRTESIEVWMKLFFSQVRVDRKEDNTLHHGEKYKNFTSLLESLAINWIEPELVRKSREKKLSKVQKRIEKLDPQKSEIAYENQKEKEIALLFPKKPSVDEIFNNPLSLLESSWNELISLKNILEKISKEKQQMELAQDQNVDNQAQCRLKTLSKNLHQQGITLEKCLISMLKNLKVLKTTFSSFDLESYVSKKFFENLIIHIEQELSQIQSLLLSFEKTEKQGANFTVGVTKRDLKKGLDIGTDVHCCLRKSRSNESKGFAILDYFMDLGMQIVEVKNEKGKVVFATWIWIGKDSEGNVKLVLDNIEGHPDVAALGKKDITKSIIKYIKEMADEIGIGKENIVLGPFNNDVDGDYLKSLKPLGLPVEKVGGFVFDKVDSVGTKPFGFRYLEALGVLNKNKSVLQINT